jgi:hypothetical protein
MRSIKPLAVLTILVPMMIWTAHAQAPQPAPSPAPGRVYPNPKTTPGDIIEPPGMAPKPALPKSVPEAQTKKEPDPALVKLDIGAIVIGSDDRNIGRVTNIDAEPNGWVKEIHVTVDSTDGTAGKIVVVKAGSFGRSKDGIRLSIPSSEVPKLPVAAGQPG